MTARTPIGWQTMLADLSLILFMVTAAAMADKPSRPKQLPVSAPAAPLAAGEAPVLPALGEPMAVYRLRVGAPPLAAWLAAQSPDPRQQLTITARYRRGGLKVALARAQALSRQAGAMGAAARIIVEPGDGDMAATLAFDRPAGADLPPVSGVLARGLRGSGQAIAIKDHAP